ncbi:MAG: baseplate J/gp47 family protein, partial [Bacteroidota bacterium]
LGLAGYQPGETLNLYFELDPATADPTLEKANVEWAYLRGNEWCPLEDETQVLNDTTAGLIQSGIVKITPPSGMSQVGTTILPPAFHWLRASVTENTAAIAATLKVSTQAAVVVAETRDAHDAGRLATALPAGSIAKLVAPLGGLKAVDQPFAAFGGRAPEETTKFNRRVSELLRHKGRAITLHDYEHLVLEAFPQVYRVKCLTHTRGVRGDANADLELAPGHVTLVVVPDLSRVSAVNPYEPRLPAADLEAIRVFLADKIASGTALTVLNPAYEPVRLRLSVRFRPGRGVTFNRQQLQRDLRQLLAPWTRPAAEGADITFGGRFYYSTAVRYVEELPYVDYVKNLSIDHPAEGVGTAAQAATGARSVLTTANGPVTDPATDFRNRHDIIVI